MVISDLGIDVEQRTVEHPERSQDAGHVDTIRHPPTHIPVDLSRAPFFLQLVEHLIGDIRQGFLPADPFPPSLAACSHALQRVLQAARVVHAIAIT